VRARRTDQRHKAVLDAIRALGYPCMSLHAAGGGLEDVIVGVTYQRCVHRALNMYDSDEFEDAHMWVMVEVKTSKNKAGTVAPSQFTPAQREWYERTSGFPRLIVTSAQDAVDQLREMTK
jgi:hypothetical protein